MTQLVGYRKFEKVGHRHLPLLHQFRGAQRIMHEESFIEKRFSLVQRRERGAFRIQPEPLRNRFPVLGPNQDPCPMAQGLDRVATQDGFQLENVPLALCQRVTRVAVEFLVRHRYAPAHACRRDLRCSLCDCRANPERQTAIHNQSRLQAPHGIHAIRSCGWAEIGWSGGAAP